MAGHKTEKNVSDFFEADSDESHRFGLEVMHHSHVSFLLE